MESLAVEVRCENNAYYKAYITDVHENEVTVVFENNWQPESKFPYDRVRLPPATPENDEPMSVIEGQEVEVFVEDRTEEDGGWCQAVVRMRKGDVYVVQYTIWATSCTEIIPNNSLLRLMNTNPPITKDTFIQFQIPVPADVQEHSKIEGVHEVLKHSLGAASCKYDSEKKCLQLIFLSSGREGKQWKKKLRKRARALSDIHFQNLPQRVLLLNQTDDQSQTDGTGRCMAGCLGCGFGKLQISEQSELKCGGNTEPSLEIQGAEELQTSLRGLLSGGQNSDVTLRVGGKAFPAHSLILRARSPIFEAMFAHDTAERQSGVVDMQDIDPESFPDFLEHVYTGSVEMVSGDNVSCLFSVADRYDFQILRKACVDYLKRNLCVASYCDTIALAEKYDERELAELARQFFSDHTLDVLKSSEWLSYLTENAAAGNNHYMNLYKLLTR